MPLMIKRIIDIGGCVAGVFGLPVLISPFYVAVAAARFSRRAGAGSPGACWEETGAYSTIYKFAHDASEAEPSPWGKLPRLNENAGGALFKIKNDPE